MRRKLEELLNEEEDNLRQSEVLRKLANIDVKTAAPVFYISGPMRGKELWNFPAFFEAERMLRNLGYLVINPATNTPGLTFEQYMLIDLAQVQASDAILLLEGWEDSEGAKKELEEAEKGGKLVLYLRDLKELVLRSELDYPNSSPAPWETFTSIQFYPNRLDATLESEVTEAVTIGAIK